MAMPATSSKDRPRAPSSSAPAAGAEPVAPVIDIEKVTKTYQTGDVTVQALRGVDLVIQKGEFVAVMGASGSGKSTLMNILGGLDYPTSGEYRLDGEPISRLDSDGLASIRNRTLGFVFQSFNLLSRTTALENVELPLLYADVPARERHGRALESLTRVGLADRIDHHPNQMSGGQQQRVAIARALVTRPKVILADEPTGNLDSETSIEVMTLFQELWRAGITILLVTHEPDIAEFAGRVVMMKDGKVKSDRRQEPRDARQALAQAVAQRQQEAASEEAAAHEEAARHAAAQRSEGERA
jgi:putative ABC transport system ATP-binding protein